MTPALSALFALCALVFALIATAAARSCAKRSEETMRILSALSAERSKIAQHESSIQDLHGRFQSLQGRFYAERRKSQPNEEFDAPKPSPQDVKARLRRQVGLVPGARP